MSTLLEEPGRAEVLAVATSHPPTSYSQQDVIAGLGVKEHKLSSIFRNAHIENRFLVLPGVDEAGIVRNETGLDLWTKHREWAVKLGEQAIMRALEQVRLPASALDYLVCVTSTGFLCPGVSALLIERLGLRRDIHRVDVVGMGCNAGLNALQPLASFCDLHRDKVGLQLCVEVCSAAYVTDGTLRNAVVNSLFGDGAAALVLGPRHLRARTRPGLELLGFTSHIMTEAIDAMRFEYDGAKYAFFLDRKIPYAIGDNVEIPVDAVLRKHGLKRRDVAHWVVHSGGKKVIDAVKCSLGLSDYDVRHTLSVLKRHGNVSSGSFLFSLEQLLLEETFAAGELVMLMTMGPGSSIECCLGRFQA